MTECELLQMRVELHTALSAKLRTGFVRISA